MAVKNFKFPLQSGPYGGAFELTETTLDTVKQNLLLFFATDENERVVNNQLGSRFRRFLFEPSDRTMKVKCENEVNRIFSTYFPQLKLVSLQVEEMTDNVFSRNAIKITVVYSLKNLEQITDNFSVLIA